MRAPIIVAAGVAALSLAAWLFVPYGSKTTAASTAPRADQRDDDDRAVAEMRRDIAALKRAAARRDPSAAAQPSAAAPDAPERARERATDPPPAPRTPEEISHGLDHDIEQQKRDAAWSPRAESAFAAAFSGDALKGSTMLRADCRTTFCRIEVSHLDADAQRSFLSTARTLPPFNQEGFARTVADSQGVPRTVVYVAREGELLPRPDE